MIGEARRVGVVLLDPQIGLVIQKAIKHVSRVEHTDVDYLGAERRILIRDVGVIRPGSAPYFGFM